MGKEGLVYYGSGKKIADPPAREPEPQAPVLPIIFVPGVMGSNVRVRTECIQEVRKRFEEEGRGAEFTDQAWRPPNAKATARLFIKTVGPEVLGIDSAPVRQAKQWESYGPKLRQVLLNPETTEVDPDGLVPGGLGPLRSAPNLKAAQEAHRRGWGSVHWESYGGILEYLERTMNHTGRYNDPTFKAHALRFRLLDAYRRGSPFPKDLTFSDDEFQKAAQLVYPVFAFGYNWTQSNLVSAKILLRKIEEWLAEYQLAGRECTQVLLVTHSMGGLVARAAAKLDQKKLILGIVHGVMPATGAPALYRRMVAGWEPEDLTFLPELRGVLVPLAGRTSAETTPVVANAPGVLELLPSHLYPPKWLKVEDEQVDGSVKELFAMPEKDDPYREIYLQKDVWWRLVDPELLDPAKLYAKPKKGPPLDQAWMAYLERILEVKRVHQEFFGMTDYHKADRTYVFFAEGLRSFGNVRWRIGRRAWGLDAANIRTASGGNGDLQGHRNFVTRTPRRKLVPSGLGFMLDRYADSGSPEHDDIYRGAQPPSTSEAHFPWFRGSARLQGPDGDGDGTVPVESGGAPGKRIANICRYRGFGHQFAFNDVTSRTFTVLALCRLALNSRFLSTKP